MIETTKLVQKFGNSGHVIVPKEYIGKRIKFITKPKTFEDIKAEVLEILKPYLESILGVYLYGSYARNEQTVYSDVDILVVVNTKFKIIDKVNDYSIISLTLNDIKKTLEKNAVLILPILKEAKTIINPRLLESFKEHRFTKKNTKRFISSSINILKLNKKGLELNFELGSLIYSLMLRIRGLLMIKLLLNNRLYSKSKLFSYLENNRFSKKEVEELYEIYSDERSGIKIKENKIVAKESIKRLLKVAERLLKDVKK